MKLEQYIQNSPSECGICCIAAISNIYGFKQPLQYFRNIFKVDRDGMSVLNIIEVLKKINIRTKVENKNNITFDYKTPCIAYVNQNHFIIIIKKQHRGFLVFDPAKGIEHFKSSELKRIYSGILIKTEIDSSFSKIDNTKSEWFNFIPLIKNNKKSIEMLLITSILSYIITLAVPTLLQKQIDSLHNNALNLNSAYFIFVPIILWLLFTILNLFQGKLMVKLAAKIEKDLNQEMFFHMLKLPYRYFENRGAGDTFYKLNLVSELKNIILNGILATLISLGSTILILCYLATINIIILIVSLFATIAIFFFTVAMSSIISKANQELILNEGFFNNAKVEFITSMLTIKAMGLEKDTLNNLLDKLNIELSSFSKQNYLSKINQAFLQSFQLFLPFFLVVVSIPLFKVKVITIGMLFSIYTLSGFLFSSSIQLFQNLNNFEIVRNMLRKINDVLDEPVQVLKGRKNITVINKVGLNKVYFKYSDQSDYILKGISLEVKCGKTMAIVGRTGSGKSTIMKLLSGIESPSSGNVYLNEINLNDIQHEDFQSKVGVVPQQVKLFNRSIKDNIILNAKYDKNKYKKVLQEVQLKTEIEQMPLKDSTQISGFGDNLSGGQAQRIALARALYRNPQILILDEATSSLDNTVEYNLNKAIQHLNQTKIIIAHRLSTIINADQIIMLKNGKIVESGTHLQLINKKGEYFKLYKAQSNS